MVAAPTARADEVWPTEPPPGPSWSSPPAYEPPRPRPLYTTPFQLRGVIPKTGVRLDTLLGLFRLADSDAQVAVAFLSGQWRIVEELALQVRWGIDANETTDGGLTGITNPTAGILFGVPIGRDFRFAASFAFGVPVATGGGNDGDRSAMDMQRQAALARSALDNTSFALNDVGLPTGLSFALVTSGVTAQIDATITPSIRVKAQETQPDSYKVNSTYGLFLGYAFAREVSLGAELRYQRYLTTPASVERDPSTRDNLTVAGGPRFSFRVRDSVWVRPGVSYGRGLRGPVEQQGFQMVQLDVPVSF
jgi:hypothetical protein